MEHNTITNTTVRFSWFGVKLRFCLFCLEHIMLVEPPRKALARDLKKLKKEGSSADKAWSDKVTERYNEEYSEVPERFY
jgi:hypothetical protein